MTYVQQAVCGINGCERIHSHRGCHTVDPSAIALEFDFFYENVVVKLVMKGIRSGRIDFDPEHARRWIAREAAL